MQIKTKLAISLTRAVIFGQANARKHRKKSIRVKFRPVISQFLAYIYKRVNFII